MNDPPDDPTDEPDATPRWLVLTLATLGAGTVALFLGHTFWPGVWHVDAVTLGLLGILLVLPFADRIEVLRSPAFEARLRAKTRRAAERIHSQVEHAIPEAASAGSADQLATDDALRATDDPGKTLALDRWALETSLRHLATEHGLPTAGRSSIRALSADLVRAGVLSQEIASLIRDVTPYLNMAVHGDTVPWDTAATLHDTVRRLLVAVRGA